MELIKDYMDVMQSRHALNALTEKIFGFSFENWYMAGHYEGEYIPYSYVENGKIIANASANIMKMVQNGKEKLYIQIGTVMTDPDWRRKGLVRELINRILTDYIDRVDGFFLYADLGAIGLYEKIGFKSLDQWRYQKNRTEESINGDCFVAAGEEYLAKYRDALRNAAINTRLDHINRTSLQLFYTGNMENVYYHSRLDCFTVMKVVDATLHLNSIICPKKIPIAEILKHIPMHYEKVLLGFTPEDQDANEYVAQKFDGADDYRLYYIGKDLEEIQTSKLFFPVMSHA